jgi:hypothetical protein
MRAARRVVVLALTGSGAGLMRCERAPARRPASRVGRCSDLVLLPVVLVHERVAAAAGDHLAVGEEGKRIGDDEAAGDARVDRA